MTEFTIEKLIESLEKFPKDKPVKILALGIENDLNEETIHSVNYPLVHYDEAFNEEGSPVFFEEKDFVAIFTNEYCDFMLMNGV